MYPTADADRVVGCPSGAGYGCWSHTTNRTGAFPARVWLPTSALTSVELTEAYLDRIRTIDPKLRPVLFVDPIA